jgi:hypothetical protein
VAEIVLGTGGLESAQAMKRARSVAAVVNMARQAKVFERGAQASAVSTMSPAAVLILSD